MKISIEYNCSKKEMILKDLKSRIYKAKYIFGDRLFIFEIANRCYHVVVNNDQFVYKDFELQRYRARNKMKGVSK